MNVGVNSIVKNRRYDRPTNDTILNSSTLNTHQ